MRVKVLQSLYAFFQSGNDDLADGEKELLFGIEKIYDLYLYQFSLLEELLRQEERFIEDQRNKHLPTEEDLNPSTRFQDNQCLRMIAASKDLHDRCKKKSINWNNNQDLVRKLLQHIKSQHYFKEYSRASFVSFEADRDFIVKLIKKDLMHFELLHHYYEEKSIYWLDDWELVNKMLIKTLLETGDGSSGLQLMELFKEEDDRDFARNLFKKTILNEKELDKIISAKTRNWDIERIALMDIIIMKMALTEILKFQNIPIKVSLNEYIELSKMYSTPKSKVFINGVLDKLVAEFLQDKKINKTVKG